MIARASCLVRSPIEFVVEAAPASASQLSIININHPRRASLRIGAFRSPKFANVTFKKVSQSSPMRLAHTSQFRVSDTVTVSGTKN